MTDEERFWSRVEQRGPNECWPWTHGRVSFGYGSFKAAGKFWSAHRFSWSIKNGPIPTGKWVLHSCDNPPCCNPAHLFLGTRQDNIDDMMKKGRDRKVSGDEWASVHDSQSVRGESNGRARLTADDVILIRSKVAAGQTVASLARELTMSEGALRGIVKRRKWKHVP